MNGEGWGRMGSGVQSESLLLGRGFDLSLALCYVVMSPCLSGRHCGAVVMGWALEKVLVLKLDYSA